MIQRYGLAEREELDVRIQICPHIFQEIRIVLVQGVDHDDSILLRADGAVLAELANGTVSIVPALPEQQAVLAVTAVGRNRGALDLSNPSFRENLLPIPYALLQVELTEAHDFGRGENHSACAEDMSFGILFPFRAGNIQRFEQTRHQIVGQAAAGSSPQ